MIGNERDTAIQALAARASVGLADLSTARGRLRLTGRDRAAWLQGLVANDLLSLPVGQGMEAAVMNVQGHLLSLLRIFALPEALLIDLPGPTCGRILTMLDQFLIMEQVEIEDRTDATRLYSVQGPRAADAVAAALGAAPDLPAWGVAELDWQGAALVVARVTHTGEDGYDLFAPLPQAERLRAALAGAVAALGGSLLADDALDLLRLEAGIPAWGRELTEAIVPLEAHLDRAISRTKGCYIGQEIIARIDARGRVNRVMVGLQLPTLPAGEVGPAEIFADGSERPVGRVTSTGHSPALEVPVALGYLRREHAAPGTAVRIAPSAAPGGAEAETIEARVVALPFVPWRFPRPIYGEDEGAGGGR